MGPNPKTKLQTKLGPNLTTIISEEWVVILRLKYEKVGQNRKTIMQSFMGPNHLTIISEKWV